MTGARRMSIASRSFRLGALSAALAFAAVAQGEVFINEIHYDNAGADSGEAVEVVATAGEDLTQYRIVRYNGNGGASYGTDSLPAGSLVSCGGQGRIGVINYPQDGLQNGSPDGLALVGPGDAVIQFLSYEGVFTASNGPAQGMTSVDIGVSEANNSPADHSLQLSGDGTQYADFQWNEPAADSFGACNANQSFGPAVDLPPTVSTTPADGATQVAVNAVLDASFSEAVTLDADWFSLACTLSGAHTASVSGGPANYTLTPDAPFQQAETCTWTIFADKVSDQDAPFDPMQADHVVSFGTFDPANVPPPTIVAIQPADGASNVPVAADVRVTFSEMVTTAPGAFSLACDGTPLTLTESGNAAQRILTPDPLLPAGASCLFTVNGAFVLNTSGIAMEGVQTASFTVSDGSTDAYYAGVNTSSPEQLRCTLHEIIKGHTVYPYSGGGGPNGFNTWTILEIAQEDPNNPDKIIDVYRNRSYNKVSDRAGTGSGITYNREHTWPNSLGFANNNLAAYTDTHMLWLSDTGQNSSRGSRPFANCASGCTELPTEFNNGVGGPGQSNWVRSPDGNTGSFEAWDHRKGEMARAMFYMAIRYEGIAAEDGHDGNTPDLELTDNRGDILGTGNTAAVAYMGLLSDLLAWHLADPPDAEELARNDVIQSFQGNRNPFVDHPQWASRALFESSRPASCVFVDPEPEPLIFADGFE